MIVAHMSSIVHPIIGHVLKWFQEAKVLLDERFENFNDAELPSGEIGDFFRLGPKQSMSSVSVFPTTPKESYATNGNDEVFRNGLPSPTDDDVFVKNSSGNFFQLSYLTLCLGTFEI